MKTLKHRLSSRVHKNENIKMTNASWRSGKKTAAERGYDHKWRKYREGFLFKNPLCVFCLKENRATAANIVDHIVPHNGDRILFWDTSNHQALCKHCHDSVKQKQEKSTY